MTKINLWLTITKISFCELEEDPTKLRKLILSLLISDQNRKCPNRKKHLILHCKENPINVFLFWELRGLSPNFYIHVSVAIYIFPGLVHWFPCSRIGRLILEIYKSLVDMSVGTGGQNNRTL
jgi:hypothetical protein